MSCEYVCEQHQRRGSRSHWDRHRNWLPFILSKSHSWFPGHQHSEVDLFAGVTAVATTATVYCWFRNMEKYECNRGWKPSHNALKSKWKRMGCRCFRNSSYVFLSIRFLSFSSSFFASRRRRLLLYAAEWEVSANAHVNTIFTVIVGEKYEYGKIIDVFAFYFIYLCLPYPIRNTIGREPKR